MKIVFAVLTSLFFVAHLARADECENLRAEIEALRQRLIAAQDRIAQLETTTSLLMAGYQQDQHQKEYQQKLDKPK